MNPQAMPSDLPPWTLPDSVIFGLDAQNNPDLSTYTFVREQILAALPVHRNVDWRRAPLPLTSVTQRCAAQGQRVGMFLTTNSCEACMRGEGPFTSCVVAAVNGTPEFSGSCMNCAWRDVPHTCSFRTRNPGNLPAWEVTYINGTRPYQMPMPAQPVYNYGSLPYPTQATQPGPQYNMFSDGVNVPPPTAPPAPAHTPDPTFDCTQAYTPGAETLSICRRTGQGPIWLGIWYDSPLRMLSWERVEERLDNIAWRRIFYELVSCRARVNWDIRVLGDEMIKAGIQFDTLPLVLPQTDFHQPCVYGVDWAPPDWPWNASG